MSEHLNQGLPVLAVYYYFLGKYLFIYLFSRVVVWLSALFKSSSGHSNVLLGSTNLDISYNSTLEPKLAGEWSQYFFPV